MTLGALLFPLDPEHVGPVEELAQPFVGAFSNGFSDRAGENDSALTHEREADGAPVFLKFQVIEWRGGLGLGRRQQSKQGEGQFSRVILRQKARVNILATRVELNFDRPAFPLCPNELGDEEGKALLRHGDPRFTVRNRTLSSVMSQRNNRFAFIPSFPQESNCLGEVRP